MQTDIRRRDSLITKHLSLFTGANCYLTQLNYNDAGLLCETLRFWGMDLESKDSFIYNQKGELTQWTAYWLKGSTSGGLYHETWKFSYEKGRIQSYNVLYSDYYNVPHNNYGQPLAPRRLILGSLRYNAKGAIEEVAQCMETYDFYTPQTSLSKTRYHFHYEYF